MKGLLSLREKVEVTIFEKITVLWSLSTMDNFTCLSPNHTNYLGVQMKQYSEYLNATDIDYKFFKPITISKVAFKKADSGFSLNPLKQQVELKAI